MSPEVCQLINQVQALSAQLTAAQAALITEIDTRAAASTAVSSANLDLGRILALDRLDVASSSRLARADPPAAPPVSARVATAALSNFGGLFNSDNYALIGAGQRYVSIVTTGSAVATVNLTTTAETDLLAVVGEAGFCPLLLPYVVHSANHAETTTLRLYIDGQLITSFSSAQASASNWAAVNPLVGSIGGYYTAAGIVATCHDGPTVSFRSSLRVTAQCTQAGYATAGVIHKTWRCA